MKLKARVMVHKDWRNDVTRDEFEECQVTGHVSDLGSQVPNLLPVTSSSGTCHQDVPDILGNKTTNKDNVKEPDIHNNMVLEELHPPRIDMTGVLMLLGLIRASPPTVEGVKAFLASRFTSGL